MELGITKIIHETDRPWLVMVHGFGGSKATWKRQIESFSPRFNILVLELPGHGEVSAGVADQTVADLGFVAEMIIATLRKEGIEQAHFLALSLGTLVVADLLRLAPHMVSSVVLCGAVFGLGFLPKVALYLGNTLKYIFPYMAVAALMAAIMMPRRSHRVSRRFLMLECKKLGRAEFMRWYTLSIRAMDRLVKNSVLLNKVPSLVVMGGEDHVFLSRAQEAVSRLGNNVRLEIIENCGHVCNIQKAAEFNRVAEAFLSR